MKRIVVLAMSLLVLAGCASPARQSTREITVYSGRNERLIGPILERFTETTGIETRVRYGDTAEMAATVMEEGAHTPAQVFISQDAAALGALSRAGLLKTLPDELLDRVDPRFRSAAGDWIGLSGRARVVVYNTERIEPEELPQSLSETAKPQYSGRFGIAPNNASFQAHMAAYMAINGEQALAELLGGIAGNEPRVYPKNSPIVAAVIAGEIDWGLVNHYYLMRALDENPAAPAKNFIMPATDGSNFVNIAGAAVLAADDDAVELVRFLLSETAQRYFADETFEYPLALEAPATGDTADFGAVSAALEPTLNMIRDTGLSRFQ